MPTFDTLDPSLGGHITTDATTKTVLRQLIRDGINIKVNVFSRRLGYSDIKATPEEIREAQQYLAQLEHGDRLRV